MVRLVSGILLASAAIAAIRFLPLTGLRVLAIVVAVLAAHEYLTLVGTRGPRRQAVPLAAVAALCALIAFSAPMDPVILLLAAFGWMAVDVLATGRTMAAAAPDVVAPAYVGAPLGMLVLVHAAAGWQATLLLVLLVVVSDSAQYYSGRMFGKHALAPAISPKKTIEGAVGGVLFGTLFMVAAGTWLFPSARVLPLALLGLTLVVLGICGDLFESRLKRQAGIKDSSALIPGHGGVLDRIDALLFAAPAFYLYIRS